MVPFAGHHMPVLYSKVGLADSHLFTRDHASLFDVSHMVQHRFKGPNAIKFLETVCPGGIGALKMMQSTLTTFLWPGTGGIVDDAVVTRLSEDEFYVVTNGACRDKDIAFFEKEAGEFETGGGGKVQRTSYQAGLMAIQGPEAAKIMEEVIVDAETNLKNVYFGQATWVTLKLKDGSKTAPILLNRGGYTGEDGFEISLPPSDTLAKDATLLADTLLSIAGPGHLQLAGLGARDSLRLEAGMCLYGHDLDDTVTPVEAALSWIIPPERRQPGSEASKFNGSEVILQQLVTRKKGGTGVQRRRVGFVIGGVPAREGAEVLAPESQGGEKIGVLTSGMPSPSLRSNIAMGYVKDGMHKAGTEVDVLVRGKRRKATVAKMPFVASNYYKPT